MLKWLQAILDRFAGKRQENTPPGDAPAAVEVQEKPAAVRDDGLPDRIGNYRVVRLLGQGGMGKVYVVEYADAAEDGPSRQYALKMVAGLDDDSEAAERFKREIVIGIKIRHPNVCRMVDWGIEPNGTMYLVMELMEGQPLDRFVDARAPMAVVEARPLVLQILSGLAAIHDAGVVHRDVKPANVYLSADGTARLMDFGIARRSGMKSLTAWGMSFGTPGFMAPEQMSDIKNVDHRVDLFNTGAIMYQMLTRRLPFGIEEQDMLQRTLMNQRDPVRMYRPDLSPEVESWLDRMLAHKPADRFASAREAAEALAHL